jgi:large repetitive protein
MMFDGAAPATVAATLASVDALTIDNADFVKVASERGLHNRGIDHDIRYNIDDHGPYGQRGDFRALAQFDSLPGTFKQSGDYARELADAPALSVIFIDGSIGGAAALAEEWAGRGQVVILDGNSDGIDQMRGALAGMSNVDAIHIVSHGVEGAFFLGTTRIDQAAIDGPLNASFAAIGRALSADGDLLIYGCDVARGANGAAFIQDLARITNADVAASIDDTGAIARGGDWTLERRAGAVDAISLVSDRYDGLLAPALITINQTSTVLKVFDANGTEVANSQTNAGFSNIANAGALRSTGIGAGGYAVWTNAGTVGGQTIDLRARVLSSTTNGSNLDTLSFDKPTAATNDPGFLLVTSSGTGTASLQVQWEMVLTGTNTPIAADVNFTIADIDGTGTNPNAPTRESVVVSTDTLSSYQSAGTTDVKFDPNTPGVITAFGTQNELANPPQPISAAKFNWVNTSAFIITYNLNRAGSTLAGFSHDGNNEFNFGTGGITTSIPRLDLDQNDSTASGSAAKRTFTENGPAVTVADSDVLVTNPVGTVQRATITLTNAQAGDVIALGALPSGISGTIDTSVAGRVTVTLTGSSTAASYQAAIAGITFRNTTERPNTTDRIVTASFFNGTFNSNVATSTITVVEVNDPPVAVNDTATTNEDTPVTISVLANDTDLDGDALTVTAATAPNGTVVRNANGTITYTPNKDFNGTDTITYTISDGRGGTSTATVTVTIAPVNDPPVPVGSLPPQKNVDAATGISVATAGGFTDVDNPTLTYSATGLPAGLSINATTGVITGTIDRSASQVNGGNYTIVVTARDPAGLTATQTFGWSVTNPAPIATDDTASTSEDTPVANIPVLANDRDPDGDPLTVIAASAANGTVTINANGTLNYTPNKDFNGTDTITYTISDGQGGTATAKVTVTVNPVNDPPIIVGQLPSQANSDATTVSVPTAGGFTDVDNATLVYSAAGLPPGLSINPATGLISGTIDRSASQVNGGIYSVVVTATDAGGLSATQRFTWTVTNPAPVAADDTASTNEDTPVRIGVLGNDRDPDGDPLTVTAATAPNGSVVVNADGTLTYTPNKDFNGTDTITYTISDGQGGTSTAKVIVTIAPVNDPPAPVGTLPSQRNVDAATGISVATVGGFTDVDNPTLTYSASGLPAGLSINATTGVITGTIDRSASQGGAGGVYTVVVTARDAGGLTATQTFSWTVTNPPPVAVNETATTNEDTAVTIAVLTNDSDPDGDPLTVIAASAANGAVVINANGTLTYTPKANFNGTDTITYTISDGQGGTSTAIVTVTVVAVNDPPVVTKVISPQANQDANVVSLPVAGNFSDVDGDTLTYSVTGLPAGLSINPATGVISGTIDRSASQVNGGVYSVTVTASDGKGGTVSTTLGWTVTNPPPTAANDSATTAEDTPIAAINVLANDRDPDGDPLTVTAATASSGTVTINPDGTLRYVPNANFNGTDTIRYTISDGQGGTATATVTVTVTGVNDVPTAKPLGNQTNLDGQVISLPVGSAFSDADGDALTFGATGLPAGLSINPATGIISGTIDRSASQVNGGVYSITVTASDGKGGTVSQTFTWTVTNPAPVAANDTATTNEDTAVRIDVLANDVDPDKDPLRVTTARAGNGTVTINPDGSLQYVPNANFNGTDTIIYTITDGEGGTSTATVTVAINSINDAPTTKGLPNQNDNDGGRVSVPVASAFSDVDGDKLSFAAIGLPPGLAIDPATGLITGQLASDASQKGPYTVTVIATDPSGASVTATFIWAIQNVPPLANDDIAITNEDTAVTVAVLANDTDPDNDPLRITTAVATNGTVVINANNTLTFTPAPDFNGVATVTYTITDGQGGFSTATLTVTVNAVNDAPDAVAIPNVTNEDSQVISTNVGKFFSDRDGDALAFSATGLPAGLSINPATGLIAGTIDKNASQPNGGVYSVTVTARDPGGLTTSRTFSWTVTNPAPTANNDTATTNEDTPIAAINVLGNDRDPDGDPLTVTRAVANNGTVTINPDGTLRYGPNANFNGTDTITYTISDGNGGTSTAAVTVTVVPVNDPPVAANDTATTPEDTPVTIPVLANDTDIDGDPLTVTAATAPNGTVVINPDGTIRYTPRADFNGTDTITYTISDGKGGTSTATVTVTVTPVNDPPVAVNDTATTPEDTPVTVPVLANDRDIDGDPLTVIGARAPNGTVFINPDGTVTYTPNKDFNGTDTITYTISDGKGGTSTATVTVTVTPVNDPPVTTGIAPQANPDAAVISLNVAPRFSDVDGDPLTFTATGLPAGLTISAAGVISGTIDKNASQPNGGVYSVTVTASDGKGGTVSTTFSWTVTNPSPVAVNDTATTNEDTPVIIAVLANDTDPDGDPLRVTAATAANGSVVINPDGTVTYTPNKDFNGTDRITYTISDGNGGTSTATVTVTVAPVNDAPVATPIANRSNVDGAAINLPVAGNFSDVDGDTLSFSASGLPAGLSINPATGVISGTIDKNASQPNGGVYSVTVTASDGKGGTVSTTFSWTVTNPPPVAVNDTATTDEDMPVTVAVLANDTDPDGDPLSVTSAVAANGTVVINPNGTITYTPNRDFNGTDTITYTISDGNGGTSTATVTVTVAPVNDPPVVTTPLPAQVNVDADVVSIPVAANFKDVDGNPLTFTATGLPAGLTMSPAGVISGTINRSASQPNGGVYAVTVTADDGQGGAVSATFTWTVTNPPPVAVNDTDTTDEDTPINVTVLTNDSDPDGDPLTVTSAVAANGTVVINPNGSITYTPRANFNGTDTITYTISDGQGGVSTATITVTVAPVNDLPVVDAPIANQANRDGAVVSVPVSGNFSDLDGDTLSFTATGLPAGLAINPGTGVISGTIDRSASQVNGGVYAVTVTADDGQGGMVSTTFTWTVTNPPPVSFNDVATTAEDTPVTISVLTNDTDPDGDPLTVTMATAGKGSVVINPNGTITYTPNANFNGTDTITYTIGDGQGGTSTATVTVTVTPDNDAPVSVGLPDLFDINSANVSVPIGPAFSDIDGDALSFSATGLPLGLSIDRVTGLISGTVDSNASAGGPTNNGIYTVTVTASDGNGGTVSTTYTWTITNTAPNAVDDSATTPEDTPVIVDVLANDTDPNNNPVTVTAVSATNGTAIINGDGTITFTPAADFNGVATVTYTITDGLGGFSTATVTINVTPVNDAPDAPGTLPNQTGVDGQAGVSIPLGGLFSDRDAGDTLTFSAAGLPAGLSIDPATGTITGKIDRSASQTNGGAYVVTVTATDRAGATASQTFIYNVTNPPPVAANDTATTNEDTPVTVSVLANDTDPDGDPLTVTAANAGNGNVVINPDGTITYTPDANFNGTDTITYTISDGQGGTSTATVTVTVAPVNDAPIADPPLPPQTGVDGTPVSISVAGNFKDADGDVLTFSAIGLPAGLSINSATGVISGTLDKNASQPNGGVYAVTVTASDGKGGTASTTFAYTVTNPPPVASDDTASTNEDAPVTISVLANDTDPDADPLRVTTASAANGTVVINPNGTITYTPNANFNGTDTITYTISDGNGGTSTATVTVTVAPVNDAPIADPPLPPQTGVDGTPVSIPVAGNFKDADGDVLTFSATGLPAGLSINPATGVISGTIDKNASQPNGGVYSVTVTASDGKGGTASTTFAYSITNPPPVAANDTASTPEDTPVTIAVLANDNDPDGDPLTVTTASAANGTVVVNPNGTITYTPNANFNGTDTITYTISDGNGGRSTATVTVTVAPVNDPPVAKPDTAATNEDTPVRIPVLANDTDVDGNPLTVTAASAPNGTVVINSDGTVTYTPNANFNGTDTITYTISDGQGGFSTTTVTVTVNPVNDPPVAVNDTGTTPEDTPVTLTVLANDTDVDGDKLTVTGATATNGTVTVNPDGTITFTPNPNFNGTAVVTYTISDGKGGTSTATATITVAPVNDPPVAVNDLAATTEDTPIRIPVLANDTDVDGNPLTVTAASAPNGTVVINPDGSVTYTPKANFNGTDTITYTISDGQGGFSTATVTVTVAPVNDPPVAVNDNSTTLEDTPVNINVLGNDSDVDGDPLTVTAATAPNGTVTLNPDGTIRYTPNANFNGTDTITYTVSDGKGGTATATVTVTVTPVNDPPIARPDTAAVNEDTPLTLDPRVNDGDPEGDPLTITNAVAANGRVVINPDGTITYTPNTNFNGTDTITYTVSDGRGGFTTSTVTVTVTPLNDPPMAIPDAATTGQNTPVEINVLGNDSDVDRDPLTVTAATAANGTVTINPDGTLRYVPNPLFVGNDTITYTISDGKGGTATATVTVTVLQGLDQPNTLQLLEFGTPEYVELARLDSRYAVDWPPIDVPLIITDTVNGFRSLHGTPNIDVRGPIMAAVNNIDSLHGIGDLDVDGHPITQVVAQLNEIRDFRFGTERLFDPRFGDFVVKGLTGFSVRQVSGDNAQVMVESVVRDMRIYVEARDIGADGVSPIVEFQFRMRDGKPLPEWIKFDARGLAIIERPADADEIRMIVRAIRADGKVIETPVIIQGATGEIQLDEKLKAGTKTGDAAPLHKSMALADASAAAEAARLAAAFQSHA